tara:strand:+ start:250 stop:1017 length:768 start_codon:yes stop_codon:yes gene_type:complete
MYSQIKIIILNWNGEKLLNECLSSVNAINYPNFSITVIDNNSTDNSKNFIRQNFPKVNIFELDKNYGFAGGYNRYFKHFNNMKEEFFMLLNNDTVVDAEILNQFNKISKIYGDKNIYGGKIYYYDDPKRIWYAGGIVNLKFAYIKHKGIREYDNLKNSNIYLTDYITGCCLYVNKKVIMNLNGFDEEFDMYAEDVDLCIRAKLKGHNCYFCPEAKLWHHVSASIGGSFSIKKFFRKFRSLFKLFYKYNIKGYLGK